MNATQVLLKDKIVRQTHDIGAILKVVLKYLPVLVLIHFAINDDQTPDALIAE